MALDLIRDADGDVVGVDRARDGDRRGPRSSRPRSTLLATGGAGRIYAASTNAFINTGDGLGMAARAGIPLEDMEFWQFHPTGVAGAGVLLTEGCRGEGGDPAQQQRRALHGALCADAQGPGAARLRLALDGPGDQGRPRLRSRQGLRAAEARPPRRRDDHEAPALGVRRSAINFANVDIDQGADPGGADHPLPDGRHPDQLSTARWSIPKDGNPDAVVNGLYAVGECACVSVHGANRLGTNSLLDLLVFGRAAGNHIVESSLKPRLAQAAARRRRPTAPWPAWHASMRPTSGEYAQDVANDIRRTMQAHCGVFRTQADARRGRRCRSTKLRERVAATSRLNDKSKVFNTARIEALEVDNLIETAQATMVVGRGPPREPRRATCDYATADFPTSRNDDELDQAHPVVLARATASSYKPVNLKPLTVETVPAQGPHVLTHAATAHDTGEPDPATCKTHVVLRSTATTPTRTPSRTCRTIEVELDGRRAHAAGRADASSRPIDPTICRSAAPAARACAARTR
jgi:succinate dehydrogenase / fumarate reductase flavoprotein subunit